jgi:hypothetical protein
MTKVYGALAIISGIVALGGYVWSMIRDLRARKREALDKEAQAAAQATGEGDAIVAAASSVAPANSTPDVLPSLSFSQLGARLRKDGFREALPGLLMSIGLLAVLLFGALALWTSLPSKLFGAAAVAVAVYVAATELRSFARAWRDHER